MKVLVSWSGGKDSSYALYRVRNDPAYEIVGLLSTFIEEYREITLHGVSKELIKMQATSLNLPLYDVYIPENAPNEVYNRIMGDAMKKFLDLGVEGIVFGDIFLEDIRRYREENLVKIGVKGIFPLWKCDTRKLAEKFISEGFKAIVVSIDTNVLNDDYLGREYNLKFIEDLPDNVDPAGENGEFHTYVYDGPIFSHRIHFKRDEIIRRGRFHYQRLTPI